MKVHNKNCLYCVRFMWQSNADDNDDKHIYFRLIVDTAENLESIARAFYNDTNVNNLSYEYLYECKVSELGIVAPVVFESDDSNDNDKSVKSEVI